MAINTRQDKKILRGMTKPTLMLFEKTTRKPRTVLGRTNRRLILAEIRRRK